MPRRRIIRSRAGAIVARATLAVAAGAAIWSIGGWGFHSATVTASASCTVSCSGSVTLSAVAPPQAVEVDFYVDGQQVGIDTSAPYAYAWDSSQALDGSHTYRAYAHGPTGAAYSSTSTVATSNTVTAQRFLSPGGFDVGTCSSSGAPCLTFDYTDQQAACSDIVQTATGTYTGAQVLGHHVSQDSCSSSTRVTFQNAPGGTPIVTLPFGCGWGETSDGPQVVTVGCKHVKFKGLTFQGVTYTGAHSTDSMLQVADQADDVLFDHVTVTSGGMIVNGAANVTVQYSDLGNCLQAASNSPSWCDTKVQRDAALHNNSNITFTHDDFHDIASTTGAHEECLYLDQGTNITITFNRFWFCETFDIFAKPNGTNYTNNTPIDGLLIQNNLFGSSYNYGADSSSNGCTATTHCENGTCVSMGPTSGNTYNNVNFSFNSQYIDTTLYGGVKNLGCGATVLGPGSGATVTNSVNLGNAGGVWVTASGCQTGVTESYNVMAPYNGFNTAQPSCGPTEVLVDANNPNTGSPKLAFTTLGESATYGTPWGLDFHLGAGSAALNVVPAANCPTLDFDGNTRDVSDGFCNAGAYG